MATKVFCQDCKFAQYPSRCQSKPPVKNVGEASYWSPGTEYDVYEDMRKKNADNNCPDFVKKDPV